MMKKAKQSINNNDNSTKIIMPSIHEVINTNIPNI